MRFRTLLAASLLAVSLVPLAAFTVLQWREAQNEIARSDEMQSRWAERAALETQTALDDAKRFVLLTAEMGAVAMDGNTTARARARCSSRSSKSPPPTDFSKTSTSTTKRRRVFFSHRRRACAVPTSTSIIHNAGTVVRLPLLPAPFSFQTSFKPKAPRIVPSSTSPRRSATLGAR